MQASVARAQKKMSTASAGDDYSGNHATSSQMSGQMSSQQQQQQQQIQDKQQEATKMQISPLLVPISVACLEERADDGTCSRSNIECISWCLVDAQTGKSVAKRQTIKLAGDEPNALAQAIEQVSGVMLIIIDLGLRRLMIHLALIANC